MIKLGTRPSRLALIQAEMVSEKLTSAIDEEVQVIPIKTDGDLSDKYEINLKSAFTRRLEYAITDGRIDAAVHSLKDFPPQPLEGLDLVSFPISHDPSDYLITDSGIDLFQLKSGSTIGTGSARRKSLLEFYRPDLIVQQLRGNVDTRVGRYKELGMDGVILSAAGLIRLGLKTNYKRLDPEFFIPAAGQGIIAVEALVSTRAASVIKGVNDPWAEMRARIERAFLKKLGGDCSVPAGIYVKVQEVTAYLKGFIASGKSLKFSSLTGKLDDAEGLGTDLAGELLH
ncbi:MAG: hydroxymethylbilane synthase [Nitrososphaerota archaeon]|nr:hydroxymethylbilane synthase [Nitrososphaerota archaeon]